MKTLSSVPLTCALLAAVAGIIDAPRAHAHSYELLASNSAARYDGQDNNAPLPPEVQPHSSEHASQPRTAVVVRFAVQSQPVTETSALSPQSCPQVGAPAASATITTPSKGGTLDPKMLDRISGEMQTKLSKKMLVMVNPDPATIPVGALVISGCVTKANGGNAASRLIGMNVGASHLAVHVVALTRTKDGWSPMDTFDIQVKGGDVLPPIGPLGLAVHAARDTQQTLSADAKKLADHIVNKLSRDMKSREQEARNSGSVYDRVSQTSAG